MSDWFQNGVITTLSKVGDRSAASLEEDLRNFTARERVSLVLPALFSEFVGPAMPGIVRELQHADYLHSVVVSLDRASESDFRAAQRMLDKLPVPVHVIWNDGPRIVSLLRELDDEGFLAGKAGKGRGVWLATGLALADRDVGAIALHDCDIVNYQRDMLARLVYPIMNNAVDFEFSKGYYTRVSDKLYGRVTRLFFTPLVASLRRVCGPLPILEYMDSFRYPLSGEFALVRGLATRLRFAPNWGLEVSTLSEVFHSATPRRICQVEIADNYEHKHQSLSTVGSGGGLAKMASEISQTLFRVLGQTGVVLSDALFKAVAATYRETATEAVEKYHALSLINGLQYDRHEENGAAEAFTDALLVGKNAYLDDPVGEPLLPAWVRVRAGLPTFSERLRQAVELDNRRSGGPVAVPRLPKAG